MADTDSPDPLAPLTPPPPAGPDHAAVQVLPIFDGSVSLWMGAKTFATAAFLDLVGMAAVIYGVIGNPGTPTIGTVMLVCGISLLLASNLMLAYTVINIKCHRYTITPKLIERERGVFLKKVDALDLGRVQDVKLVQNVLDRLLNIGTIQVFSSDKSDPVMHIEAIPDPRPVYEKMRDAVIAISQRRGVVPMG